MLDYESSTVGVPVDEVIPFYGQALQVALIHFAQLFNVAESIVADREVGQVREEFDTVESGQIVVTQKQLLNFRKLLEEGLVLRVGVKLIELKRRDVLVVERQFITGNDQARLVSLIPRCTAGAWSVRSLACAGLTL